MFSRLSDKLQTAFECLWLGFIVKAKDSKSLRAADSFQRDSQVMQDEAFQSFHDLDHLSGSWVADEAFDEAVKTFGLIDQARIR